MNIIDVVQGTPEWHQARAGRVTASRIADLTAKVKSGPSASRTNYAAELVAELLTGTVDMDGFKSVAMERGNLVEAEARSHYSLVTGEELRQVGFVLHPTITMAGASPDCLVGEDGLAEFKCPNTATHIDTLLGGSIPGKYMKQMQWQMACTGRKWVDFVSYDNRLPGPMRWYSQRVDRDDKFIAELEAEVVKFLSEVDETVGALRQKFLNDNQEEIAA